MSENNSANSVERIPTEVEKILMKIENEIETASAVPFSGKKMVDADQIQEFIDSIRLVMPNEMKSAKDVTRDKNKIISDANNEAEQIISSAKAQAEDIVKDAKAQADKLVSQQEITNRANEYAKQQAQRANEEAAAIIGQAKEKEQAIRKAMVENINSSLTEAASVLEKNLNAVVNTRDAIAKIDN